MGVLSRVKSFFGAGREGTWRGPFHGQGELGGWYELGRLEDGYQRNLAVDGLSARYVPGVYACVMTIARSSSQCYPRHIRVTSDGRFEEVTTSAASRVLMNPNSYQTAPDFLLNLIAQTLFDGEAFCVVTRNNRFEVSEIHLLPRGSCSPYVDPETREIFYSVGENPLAPGSIDYIAPARDVLHLKFHTPRHPLIGESPIKAAALAIGINVALSASQATFFNNMNRPSGILSTDQVLNREQLTQLRAAFEEQSKGLSQGRIPVLGGGLKFAPLSISSQDAELVQAQRMSLEDIARCFGVPTPLIGDLSHATLNNAETLVHHFLSMSLGSYLEHIERAFDRLFGLDGLKEYIELDTTALLRTDFAGRIEGLTKGVQGGLFTPNEARNREGLGPIDGGDTAYLQRQMTPVDKISDVLESEISANNTPEPAPQPKPEPTPAPADKEIDVDVTKTLVAHMIHRKKVAA
jgi:HK97 family phage portal protein